MPNPSPTLQFDTPKHFRAWLAKNHARSPGIWMRICKKGASRTSITYAEALDESLCYGWIDGQRKSSDAETFLQKFTPRRPKSGWSKINTRHAHRLIDAGQMTPAGRKAIEAAKADGRWAAAYDSPANASPPSDFLRELNKKPRAKAFFKSLARRNLFAITYRIQTAKKPETRARRIQSIIQMLAKGETFHP